jgi:hypothetical protein
MTGSTTHDKASCTSLICAHTGSGEAAVQRAAEAVANKLNVTKESALPACLIADVELSFTNGRRLLQDDDDHSWNQGISSKLHAMFTYH